MRQDTELGQPGRQNTWDTGHRRKLIEEEGLYRRIWRIQGSQQDDGTDHRGGAA